MTDAHRFLLAAALAILLALYATIFARQTHDLFDLPTWIDLTEWPATLLFLGTAWFAWARDARLAAALLVAALIAFYAANARFVFEVPLGFVFVTLLTLAVIAILPPRWGR